MQIAQQPISSIIIFLLLTGWMISDSRFDFALHVKLASIHNINQQNEKSKEFEITPNSTTPDIQVNWFSSTSGLNNQYFASNNAGKNDERPWDVRKSS